LHHRLPEREALSWTATVAIGANVAPGTPLTLSATASSADEDSNPANNTATLTTTALLGGLLLVQAAVGGAPPHPATLNLD
jgi:hypothetical protein